MLRKEQKNFRGLLYFAAPCIYTGAKTVVRTFCDNGNCFMVKVGMHQCSELSPLLFLIVMEAVSRKFRVTLPWESYADDVVAVAETEDDVISSRSSEAS